MPRALAALALSVLLLACEREGDAPAGAPVQAAAPAWVGGARCAACHPREAEAWRGSHHDRALDEASARLGDFSDARFEQAGLHARFFERDGRPFVNTEGPDGKRADFPVAYTFGFTPLQQVLLPLPGGRLQALTVAWDARPREAGGQRWYSLYPDETLPPGDVLHWTRLAQNWNGGCAACHSTNLRRGYDLARDVYTTTWTDPDVACEACHGPGSLHVAWAERGEPGGDPGLPARLGHDPGLWRFAEGAPIARREPPRVAHTELEVCAPCHARRASLREAYVPGTPFLDSHRPALLEPGLYEADGQMREEVYVYGSFLQSRMYAAGVSCSDCHEPHAGTLRAGGNALCAGCHQAEHFDAPAHHHHAAGSPGADCVACHLPVRTYMGIDRRRDHSFRVPRPDLSVAIGTPNACNDCHTRESAAWAARAVSAWFPAGRSGTPHYASALHAGRNAEPGAEAQLRALALDPRQPAIARASALTLLAAPDLPATADAIARTLADPDPLVRLGALVAAESLPPGPRAAATRALLDDPLLAVRIDAARVLADVEPAYLPPAARTRLEAVLDEYRAAQRANADRPEAHLNLGQLALRRGDVADAREAFGTALRLAPWFVPARVNLADLERAAGREDAAEEALREAIARAPEQAEPHFALGLLLVRTGRRDEAIASLEAAVARAPDQGRFAQALALAFAERGDAERARATLDTALARRPGDRSLRLTAALLARDRGQGEEALAHARALAADWPDDPRAQALIETLERDGSGGPAPR